MDIKKFNFIGNSNSKEFYADWKFPVTVDGEGVRGSIYLSGCLFNCKGCYNKKIQDFWYGSLLTMGTISKIINALDMPQVQGLSIMGGDPMLNTSATLKLIKAFRNYFMNSKDIWLWTGYTWEELRELSSYGTKLALDQLSILQNIDVLIDGQFKQELHDPKLAYRGSSNQRIIDVQKSLMNKSVVLWKQNG